MKKFHQMYYDYKHSYAISSGGRTEILKKINEPYSFDQIPDMLNKNPMNSRYADRRLNKHPSFNEFKGCENMLKWPQLRLMKEDL